MSLLGRSGRQLLINGLTVHVGTGTNLSGFPTNQDSGEWRGTMRFMSDAEKPADRGRPIALDPLADSASRTEPAFIARPEGAPVYYGFQILSDVVVDGFTFGKISDFEAEACVEGERVCCRAR